MADVCRSAVAATMVKHITVRWEDERASSHAYKQLIPHRTLQASSHLYAPPHFAPPDSSSARPAARHALPTRPHARIAQPTESQKQQQPMPIPLNTAPPLTAPSELVDEEEDQLSSPESPTRARPSFLASPNQASLHSAQSHIDAIDAQLAQLKAEAEDEAAGSESARKQQRTVSAALTRRDVLQFRHSGCTGNVQLNDAVNRLMGSEHRQLAQLYQPRHRQPPPVPVEQHERRGTVGSRNATVDTAPSVFFSALPRFGADRQQQQTAVEAAMDREVQWTGSVRGAASGRRVRHAGGASLAAPHRTVPAERAATEKAVARWQLDSRRRSISTTDKRSATTTGSAGVTDGSSVKKQSSPPPRPNPPPPAPTPHAAEMRLEQRQTAHERAQLPPRPGWLSWRVGPGTDTNQPAAHQLDGSHVLLTIGRAEWREVEVGGERRGKARVRQRRLEDEWQWHERLSREKRSRANLTQQTLLPLDHGRVHEYDVAIEREKAMERGARQQLIREEQRLEAMLREARQVADQRHASELVDQPPAASDTWTAHAFVHPTFPPPPPPTIPAFRTHSALSHAASQPQYAHFTAAPASAAAPVASPPRPATLTSQSAKQTKRGAAAASSTPAQRAASPKTGTSTDRAAQRPTGAEAAVAAWQLPPPPPPPPLPLPQPSSSHSNELDFRLQLHVQRYVQQLRHDNAMVERDERYVRSMGSKDVRRQQIINNIARARRDIRQKEAELAVLRRQLADTQQRRQAADVLLLPSSATSSSHSRRVGKVGAPRLHIAGSSSKAVQVPEVFVAVRETSDSRAEEERWRLQRSIESDMAAIVRLLHSKVDQSGTQRSQQEAERTRVEVEDVTSEEWGTSRSVSKRDDELQPPDERDQLHEQHEHEHHYVTHPIALRPSDESPQVNSEAMHARALRLIQGRQIELSSQLAAGNSDTAATHGDWLAAHS